MAQYFHLPIQYLYIFFFYMAWSTKNGDLSITSNSTSILGHVPISSLKLNASQYLYSISISYSFSEVFRLIYFSNISLPVKFCLSSSFANQGYGSVDCSSSLFKVFVNLLNSSQSTHTGPNST